nr:retrovirus-related Pol polyprotein from transposon TNT 1-94 [Tanacetum cinerariifolium]
MSRDVLTVGSTMRILLLYRGEYSQWVERFINYLEEQTDGEAMINSIKNGDQPLPRVTQVSIAGTSSTEQPPLKIDRLARSLLIQRLPNDIYSLIVATRLQKTYGMLWQGICLVLNMKQYATMMRQNKNLIDINIDALYNILKQNQGDVNDAMGSKKKTIVVTSDPLALIAEKTKVSKPKEKVVVSLDSEGSEADDFSELKKITALLAKDFNRRKFYSKPTNNNLRTSSTSQVKCYNCKKEGHFAKDCKKVKVKDYEYYKTKMLIAKEDNDEQVHSTEDQAWMESSSDSDQEINANMVFMAQIEKVLSDSEASSSSREIFHDAIESASENFIDNHIDSQKDYDKCDVDHNDSEQKDHLVDKLIRKFNKKIIKCQKRIEKANQQSKDFENQNNELQDKYDVLKNQATTFEINNKELNEQLKKLNEKNNDLLTQTKVLRDQLKVKHVVINTHVECKEKYAKLKAERYEYMIRYSAYFDNDKQHRKQIADQQVLYDEMSVQLVELDKHVRDLKNTVLEKDFKISELEECVCNKDLENQTSSLKPYVPNVILEKIIIDLEDEVVSLLEKEKAKSKTIEYLKSKGFELSENVSSASENQTENDCLVIEKECDKEENLKEKQVVLLCNDAMNVSCNSRMFDLLDDNNFFIFDDESVKNSPVSKMPFRKKPRDSMNIVQICLWIIDSGCSKHMTGNRALLTNFVEKFIGTVRFGNNDFAMIAGYGDVVIGSMSIKKVYYVEGVGHNLFSIGQFCDNGLEVAFRKSTCFVRNEDGVDLLTGDRSSNLYTIALNEVASNSLTCLLLKASSSQSWLCHQRLSPLNFATINNLVKNNLDQGLPEIKFKKDHLCSACEQGKIHQKHHKSKTTFASNMPLYLLYMDLCGPMRIQSINGKRYVLVVVDDYSWYTWVFFLHSKDEASDFKNKTLAKFFDEVGITQQFSAARTPQQNGVVERRNRTLVEAVRTLLTFANLPSFLLAEAIATACFTQNRLIIHKHFNKTPYELINKRKSNIKFFRVFGCRYYLLNDYEDVGKLKAKGDIGVFVGYSKESATFRIYNKRTRKIHKSVNVNFDEISEMASKQFSLEPGLSNLNEIGKSSNPSVSQVSKASKKDLEDLFQDFYNEYFDSSKIMKSTTTNVATPIIEEVFHEVSEAFQGESSSSSLNDDVQQSPKEVILPQTNTQSISINMVHNGDEASTSHNVFNERLEDAYFDASTSFHDPSNV